MRIGLATLVFVGLLTWGGSASAYEVLVDLPQPGRRLGHVAVKVRTFDADRWVIYDFGRYGKVWGDLKLQGEGIIRVWRGTRGVRAYLHRRPANPKTVGYSFRVTEAEERRIQNYYENLLKTALWSRRNRMYTSYRLPRDYDGVTTQCSAVALEGLKAVWPRERWKRILHPRFNRGRGLGPRGRAYFFRMQSRLNLDDVMLPLDLIAAFREARDLADVGPPRRYR